MNDSAFLRTRARAKPPKVNVGVKLLASDSPAQRAANILELCHMTVGDRLPEIHAAMTEAITAYAALDRVNR